jgi:SOS response regulatory protein OraA/RecX
MQDHRIGSRDDAHEPRQTIEQIEAHAAAVLEEERQALRALAACMRELAVRLPVESKLPVRMAKAARSADLFSGGDVAWVGLLDVERLVDEWGREQCERLLDTLAEYLGREVS